MAATLKALRSRHERRQLELELRQMDAAERMLSGQLREALAFGDWVDPRGYLTDDPDYDPRTRGLAHVSRASDREAGKNYPVFQNLTELATIRGEARWLSEEIPAAKGMLLTLTNYVIGTGWEYTVAGDPELAALAQKVIDEFRELNDWDGSLDREQFRRAHRDGEYFLRLFRTHNGVEARIVEPEFVIEPDDPGSASALLGEPADWQFGIGTDPRDVQTVKGYVVLWPGAVRDDWELVLPHDLQHVKVDVDRNVKRGLSSFYTVRRKLRLADKVVSNVGEGAAVQAAIALIREHVPGASSAGVTTFVGGKADETHTVQMPAGSRTLRIHRYLPGSALDIPFGQKYHPGPMGTPQGPVYLDVVQGILRSVAQAWSMPEFMVSADASNANYASTLVAEAPFVKHVEVEQHTFKRHFANTLWRVLALSLDRFARWGVESIADLKRLLKLDIQAGQISVRNLAEEESIREKRHAAGILSLKTWTAQADLDWEAEQANLDQEPKPAALQAALESFGKDYP